MTAPPDPDHRTPTELDLAATAGDGHDARTGDGAGTPRGTDRATDDLADSFAVVRREVALRADADAVWEQLADADGLSGWLADEVDVEVRPGADGTVRDHGGSERSVRVEDVEPGRRLSLVWTDAGDEETLVELTVEPADDGLGTRVVVVELPLRTFDLVGPALERIVATGGGGAGAATASAALAGCR